MKRHFHKICITKSSPVDTRKSKRLFNWKPNIMFSLQMFSCSVHPNMYLMRYNLATCLIFTFHLETVEKLNCKWRITIYWLTQWYYHWINCKNFSHKHLHVATLIFKCIYKRNYFISYPSFAYADTGIYPHLASQYQAWPSAARGIAMLRVDKFPYPRKQTRGNEFIPCSNSICDILKRFRSFKIPAITVIWLKSPHKHSVTRSYRSGKESGRRSESDVINDVPLSLYLTLMTSNVRYASIFHGC